MSVETERKAEAFRRWKEDLLAREPKRKTTPMHISQATSYGASPARYTKPPHLDTRDREIAHEMGQIRYEEEKKFQMWQHELAELDKVDALEQRCAFNGNCSTCGMPMAGMSVRERAEHYVREEVEKMRQAERPDSVGE